jgi:hypothetical protein
MRWRIAHLVVWASLAFSHAAFAQASYCGAQPSNSVFAFPHFDDKQMYYTSISNGGARILMAEGGVGDQEGERLESALQHAGNIDEVWLSSPGGNLEQGEAMGRVLRRRGLMVRVPTGRACISACTIAFLGGQVRAVDHGAYYGIHMFSVFFDDHVAAKSKTALLKDLVEAEKIRPGASSVLFQQEMMNFERFTAQGAGKLAKYLVEMSASLDFLTGMFGQPQMGVCFVNKTGRVRYNITNIE